MVCKTALAACFVALVLAAVSTAGCCNDVDDTACLSWDDPTTCPPPEVAAEALVDDSGTVNSAGTFWPAHEYLINGETKIEPAKCCYEITVTTCTKELH